MPKTILSFYIDDTNPYVAPSQAFKSFLDFASSEGIAGEASLILGYDWQEHGLLSHHPTDTQLAFIEQMQRAYGCGIDTHFELMTHSGLYDFTTEQIPEGAIHEGLWLHEPAVSIEDYEAYLGNILTEGEKVGVRFTGMTWPGCGCPACTQRYRQLWYSGFRQRLARTFTGGRGRRGLASALRGLWEGPEPNPNMWRALLNLARQGRFRGRTVPCFFGADRKGCEDRLMAQEGEYAVFDLPPNAPDRLGLWLNDLGHVDADAYITPDGNAGRIVELVRGGAPYCLWYAHWQGVNPANGVGWEAFQQLVARIQRHLGDQVIWMRPSQITDGLLQEYQAQE